MTWMQKKGDFLEETINESDQNKILDVRWSPDGTHLCICIDDGSIIVGSVEGERVWNKKIDRTPTKIQW